MINITSTIDNNIPIKEWEYIKKNYFDTLPDELLIKIIEKSLPQHKNLCHLSLVSNRFSRICNDNALWKPLCEKIIQNFETILLDNPDSLTFKQHFKNKYTQIMESIPTLRNQNDYKNWFAQQPSYVRNDKKLILAAQSMLDKGVVLAAIRQNRSALQYASEER